jgi:hypothetical protein
MVINTKYIIIFLILMIALTVSIYYINQHYELYTRRKTIGDNRPVGNDVSDYLEAKYKNIVIYDDIGEFWCPAYHKTKDMKYYAKAWKDLIPEIKTILKSNYIEPNPKFNDSAIFHFRCSDSPFDGDKSYALLPKEYYYFVADIINKNDKVKKIQVITNRTHHKYPLADKKCPEYMNVILDWLEEKLDKSKEVVRKPLFLNVKNSYRAFLGSEILFQTPSSFSFIPGMTKGKKFISPTMLGDREIEEKYKELPSLVHWTMWDKFDCIPHSVNYKTYDYKNNICF